jgi:toxin YhaV
MTSPSKLATAHGWTLLMHPLFELQLNALIGKVEALKAKHPDNYKTKNDTKRLAAIEALVFDIIPQDPARPDYRQGSTLGAQHKHWFRAKFFQQYRLFFRYHQASKIIVYAWVNDETTLRAYNSKTDAYQVFARMLQSGNPPDDWDALIAATKLETLREDIQRGISSGAARPLADVSRDSKKY